MMEVSGCRKTKRRKSGSETNKQKKEKMNVQTLTFGIEVETGMPSGTISPGAYHRGSLVPNFPERGVWEGASTKTWTAQSDASINVSGRQGVEFVSPPLQGLDGLENLSMAVARIKAMGAKVNATCGVHVHVGFPSNDLAALRRLVHLVAHWEKAMFVTTGTKSREQNHYCQSIKTPSTRNANYRNSRAVRESFGLDRYRTLNLCNLLSNRIPTVEFRLFSGSTNPDKIVAWTMLCLSLVESALTGKRAKNFDMPETSTARETGEGEGEKLVKAMLNDLWVWNGKSKTACQFTHPKYTHKWARKQLLKMARTYDALSEETVSSSSEESN